MTSEDFVDEFNKEFVNEINKKYTDDFHAVADNHGRIKVLNRSDTIMFDYNGKTWEFRGDGYAILKFSTKTLELMAEYAKGDIDEHIGLNWEN